MSTHLHPTAFLVQERQQRYRAEAAGPRRRTRRPSAASPRPVPVPSRSRVARPWLAAAVRSLVRQRPAATA